MTTKITNTMIDEMEDVLLDRQNSKFQYMGFGTGAATPVATGTQISGESIRKARQEVTRLDQDAEFVTSAWLGATEGSGQSFTNEGVFVNSGTATGTGLQVWTNHDAVSKTSEEEFWVDVEVVNDVEES